MILELRGTVGTFEYWIFNGQLLCDARDTLVCQRHKVSTILELAFYWKEAKFKK